MEDTESTNRTPATPEDFAAVADEQLATATADVLNRYHDVLRRLGDAE